MAVNDLTVIVPFYYLVKIIQPNLKSIEDTTMNTYKIFQKRLWSFVMKEQWYNIFSYLFAGNCIPVGMEQYNFTLLISVKLRVAVL